MQLATCLHLLLFALATNLVLANNSTNSDAECEIFDPYCVARSAHDNCSSTVIYPYKCASDPDESKCDFILDWRIEDQILNFTLTWYAGDGANSSGNSWIGLIFSSDFQNEVTLSNPNLVPIQG